ncbi:hypothetical protein SAMN05428970_2021 [Agromyces sp. CF514]|uniref:hypothetical protein n=1 Tax=Agromyces sp. CF514 TaxID=1881031 RepID=UPI0008EE6DA4|nr:hypothetical protein [Agromyces sp. CF514]SFR76145.1 hypothetical protein SAMN05428970_2021 [Agromyces sp. CF514]
MTVVTFGGFTFDDQAVSGFTLADMSGWYRGAPSRRGDTIRKRPQNDGAFGSARFFRDGRVITVEGSYIGSSIADAYAARDRLESLQADGLSSEFAVTDELGTRSCMVELLTEPTPDEGLFSPFFKFAFDVFAADARKYGPELVASSGLPASGTGITYPITYPITYGTAGDPGRVTVSNSGRQESFSLFEVAGGLDAGFELKEIASGRRLRFERLIPLGSTVFLNPRTGRAYLDVPDNDVTGFLTVREWWSVPAGVSQEIQFSTWGGVSGVPSLTARTRPAF